MVFSKFTQPKWQHQDSTVRASAIEDLHDLDILSQIAQEDEESSIRQAAVAKIEDLTILRNIAEQDANAKVRAASQQRFLQVLCGQEKTQVPLTERLSELNQILNSNTDLLSHIAKNGAEPELRLAVLDKIQDETLISDMAIHDQSVKVRLAAVDKLTQESALDHVSKSLKNKDKRVSRAAHDKLTAMTQRVERSEKVGIESQEICTRLETLGTSTAFGKKEHTELMQLQVRWEALEKEAKMLSVPLDAERYQQARDTLHQRELAFKTLQTAKQTLCDQSESLLADIQTSQKNSENFDTFPQRLTDIQAEWASVQAFDDEAEEAQWQARFKKISDSIEIAYTHSKTGHTIVSGLEAICKEAENLLESDIGIRSNDLKNLKKRWADSAQSVDVESSEITDLHKCFDKAIQALKSKLEQQTEKCGKYLEQLEVLLKETESALEKGELQTAISKEREARNTFRKIVDLPSKQHNLLENRFQTLSSKIKELKSWQRWGNHRERENLCQAMEDLAKQEEISFEKKAQLIRESQDKWKSLDSKASNTLWRRFSKACDVAYEPCKAYFEQKAQERKENALKREELCARLESFAAEIDWEKPNWKSIFNTIRDIDKTWRSIGTTDRKLRKTLSKRFDETMETVQTHLDEERERNLKQRTGLIAKAKAANDIEDLNEAIEIAKKLQSQWEITVPTSHRAERELWKDFHSACDKVFDRRRQEFQQSDAERQANLEKKDKICKDIETLADSKEKSTKALLSQFETLKDEWNAVGEIPRKVSKGAERRFNKVCQYFEKAYQAHLVSAEREQLEKLREKASLCLILEQAETREETEIATVQEKWENLDALKDSRLEKAVTRRFKQACETTGQTQSVEKIVKEKETLCIRMEILAGIESPPEALQARMQYQVERLSKAMGDRESEVNDKDKDAQAIAQQWYTTGGVFGEKSILLEQRFNKALQAFHAQ